MKKLKQFYWKYLHNAVVISIVLAFALNLFIESLARHSLASGFGFFLQSPQVFLYNVLIIFATMSLALVIKRRVFLYVVFSLLWMTLGITNGVILANRMTPFTTKDFTVLEDGLSIVTNYLSTGEIILACVGVAVGIVLILLLFKFAPKKKMKINYKRNVALLMAIGLGLFGATDLAIKTKVVDTFFGNLAYAYRDYGVPYCFINTWLNTGIGQPAGYSQNAVLSIFDKGELGDEPYAAPVTKDDGKKHANVIFLQMESFIDPTLVKNITYSKDPIPNFRALEKNYSSGYLTVPVVGAGTANTEFEMLTGMSVKFFGPGEYPYKSILTEETSESIPYDLKSLGYATHAIHNHRAVFYGRNEVFANLGFDSFTSVEYMNHVVRTPKNWAKDSVLTGQIMDALEATDQEDFIYTCSVQGHGKYPTEQVIKDPEITVTGAPTEELRWQYEYYANQIHEMDQFIGQLTDRLSKYDEDVVLVIYGDHLPVLEMTEEDMKTGSLFETQYVVWSNFDMKKQDKPMYSYQLGADVLNRLGIHVGVLNKYHQNHQDSRTYKRDLEMLEYDMLYGKRYIFDGKNPYERVDMKMGIKPITIKEVVQIGNKFYLKGENFTEYSKISLDGEILKTIFLGSSILGLQEEVDPDAVSRMKVSQVEKNNDEILSTTE
ncbi:LTA synthase family protein [Aminipila butyrica]|uniref:LTA synthase family protein n=1 Tax=Aminipila butyrica TaxID=433296 RepID=A0A858BVE0_9FIRM|nr:LTA synthase family protein [Aminipila butyrica]QIB68036.1 LTA synthase family protein [Aminipila butyrica]